MHKTVKRFGLDGVVGDDSMIASSRERMEAMVIQNMRELGYTPVLGMGPYWSTEYNVEKDHYNFVLSVYGVYVGRKKACQMEGISVEAGREIRLSTPRNKSSQSSPESE